MTAISHAFKFSRHGPHLRAVFMLAMFVLSGMPSALAAPGTLSDKDMASLARGEILIQTIDDDRPGAAARVSAMFDSDADSIWNIIGYCEYEYIYIRGMKFCEMLEVDQFKTKMKMRHRIRNSWYSPLLDFTFEAVREPGGDGRAYLTGGNLKLMESYWRLSPPGPDNGLIVTHEIRIQTKIPAPRWLVRRSLRRDLPDMLACIRGLAGASVEPVSNQDDLKRCPGEMPDGIK